MNTQLTAQSDIEALTEPTPMAYNCRLCSRPGVAYHEAAFVTSADAWRHLLHCNRCADYRATMHRLVDRIEAAATFYAQERNQRTPSPAVLAKCDERFIDLTKRIAAATCRQWRVDNVWSSDFVAQIKEQPHKAAAVCRAYASGVRRLAAKPQSLTTPPNAAL